MIHLMLSTSRYFFLDWPKGHNENNERKTKYTSSAGECKGESNKQEDLNQVDQRLKFSK